MRGPEEAIERMIENDIDWWVEHKHLVDIPIIFEGLGEDYE